MNKTNKKLTLIRQFVEFLNSTVTFEEESGNTVNVEDVTGATAPSQVYTIDYNGVETILNVYEDGSVEPSDLPDGKYAILDEDNKGNNAVIEGGKFAGVEPISEPSSEPVTPTIQEDEKKEEEETGNDDDARKALEEALARIAELEAGISERDAKIAELEAKIAEMGATLEERESKILEMSKEPSTKPVVTRKDGNGTDGRIAAFGKKFM